MRLWLCCVRNAVRQCWWVSATSSSYLSDSNVTRKDETNSTGTSISIFGLGQSYLRRTTMCLGFPLTTSFSRWNRGQMSFEGYCHLAKVSVCPDPCQRIGKRTPGCAVLCVQKSTIRVNIRCFLYIVLQWCLCTSVWEISKGNTAIL